MGHYPYTLSIEPAASDGPSGLRWRVRIDPAHAPPVADVLGSPPASPRRPAAAQSRAAAPPPADQPDAVYLERFYRHTPEGVEAARDWGVDAWGAAEWQLKYEKIVATYTKKATKARKKGAVGAAADYKELLYSALTEKYGIDPRALPPPTEGHGESGGGGTLELVPDAAASQPVAGDSPSGSLGGMTPEERTEALVQRFSELRQELKTPPSSPPRTQQLSPPTESPDPSKVAAQVRAQLAAKRSAEVSTAVASRSDALPPFLTPMTWQSAPAYAAPGHCAPPWPSAAYSPGLGMLTDAPIDLALFSGCSACPQPQPETEPALDEGPEPAPEAKPEPAAEKPAAAATDPVDTELLAARSTGSRSPLDCAVVCAASDWAVALIDETGHAEIPESRTTIEPYAFYRRGDLTSVAIPKSVTRIGEYAFYRTGLEAVEIPKSVKSIGDSAFGLTGLTSLGRPISDTGATLEPEPELEPSGAPLGTGAPLEKQHTAVHMLLGLQALCIYVPRLAMPLLVPFICDEYSFTAAAQARLLGAFFPAYMITMVPLGWVAQTHGAKVVLQLGNVGTAVAMLLLPAMASAGANAASLCFFLLGLLQGPFVPAHNEMKRAWVAEGPGKPLALMIIGLGNRIGGAAASTVTPVLAAIFGWRAVAYVYGAAVAAFSIFWQFKVTNGPGSTGSGKPPLASPAQEEASGAAARKSAAQGGADSSVNTQIFGVRAAQVIMLMHWNANFTEITLLQWAPTYLNQALGVPLAQLGKYLLAPALIEQVANIGAASAESLLLARGISTLTLRRAACVAASLTQALGMLLFGLARSPALASLAMCMVRSGDCLHNSGYNVNYLEVGGKDTALLSAVGNCAASAPGFIIPPLSLALRRMSGGGWLGVFIVPAVLQAVCASLYVKYASLAPARATLDDKTA